MGEYFAAYNHTRREWFNNHACGGGVKRYESLGGHCGRALWALVMRDPGNAVEGRWAGDRIEVIGDSWSDDPEGYADIGEIVEDYLVDSGYIRPQPDPYEAEDYDEQGCVVPAKITRSNPWGD